VPTCFRRRFRRPSPALVVALLALAVALAPAASALVSHVRSATYAVRAETAKYADNAGRVDGFHASRYPRNGFLLALDAKTGQFPARVLPNGGRGPAGPNGQAGPSGPQGPLGPAGAGVPLAFAADAGGVSTSSASYVDLGGPSVTVNVPSGAFLEVYARTTFAGDDGGAVALFEDGSLVPGQDPNCGAPASLLSNDNPTAVTLASGSDSIGVCGSTGGIPSAVLLTPTPGTHTYSLRYELCSCPGGSGTETFSNRSLWVAVRPGS
jgi:hypothetical protein